MSLPPRWNALEKFYATFLSASDIAYVSRHPSTGHTMPTLDYGIACDIKRRHRSSASAATTAPATRSRRFTGALAPAATSLSGTFVTLDQSSFLANPASHSLADTGYAYVPASCAAGESCRIHVAFHGCLQQASNASVGSAFYQHAGYNEWADTNHIIVLYPQTIVGTGTESNANACWDWWGYDSADYANKNGPQMRMVRAMVAHFAGR